MNRRESNRLRAAFLQEVLEVLADNRWSSGSFSKNVTLRSGEVVTHRFGQNAGIIWLARCSQYRNTFQAKVPVWVTEMHPVGAARVLGIAIEAKRQLPEDDEIIGDSLRLGTDRAANLDAVDAWARRYAATERRRERSLSDQLRAALGCAAFEATLTVAMDAQHERRERNLAALKHLYQQPGNPDPSVRWAHDLLGGWYRRTVDAALYDSASLTERRFGWPFRDPQTELGDSLP